MKKSIEENKFTQTTAFQKAVSDKEGTVSLNIYKSNPGGHSIVRDRRDTKEFTAAITVPTVVLDLFLAAQGVDKIDVIKMDIEGAESLALSGMSKTLGRCEVLFTEMTPGAMEKIGHSPQSMLNLLRSKGFTLYEINEKEKSVHEILDDAGFIKNIDYAANLLCKKI